MEIKKITILGGYGRNGEKEQVDQVDLGMGELLSVVGPTGSGKTALINDIGLFADEDTPSRRRILINDAAPSEDFLDDPAKNPIALITQHTGFLSDMKVSHFLDIHARVRKRGNPDSVVADILDFANQLTGEPIILDSTMTELSGGQSRALLIADAVIIGNSPIILLDEIENAGINLTRALEMLRKYEKIFIFVTHDPRITLSSDYRIVMKGGAMQDAITTSPEEKRIGEKVTDMDKIIVGLRDRISSGEHMLEKEFQAIMELVWLT
ncbi:MAG: ATP-binding cassette domain-containing protein [Gallionellaceae bacterium]|nr:ATP-binding cassette domain-containing protein [Gallionellaceae bacterium]